MTSCGSLGPGPAAMLEELVAGALEVVCTGCDVCWVVVVTAVV